MGLVDSGLQVFESITLIQPEVQHCGCLVDLLGQASMLEEAKKAVRKMHVEPDSEVFCCIAQCLWSSWIC
ncbi:hypothetical protein ACFX2J_047064 [Malus domestica]